MFTWKRYALIMPTGDLRDRLIMASYNQFNPPSCWNSVPTRLAINSLYSLDKRDSPLEQRFVFGGHSRLPNLYFVSSGNINNFIGGQACGLAADHKGEDKDVHKNLKSDIKRGKRFSIFLDWLWLLGFYYGSLDVNKTSKSSFIYRMISLLRPVIASRESCAPCAHNLCILRNINLDIVMDYVNEDKAW